MNVVITGGSKGIGKAIAMRFAQKGHNIAICARNEERLKKTEKEINQTYPLIDTIICTADLSDNNEVQKLKKAILTKWDKIDVLINNAGIFIAGQIRNEAVDTLPNLIENNLYSAYYVTKALLPSILLSQQKHIFNICSIASLGAYANGSSYSISKFAMLGFSKNLREELKEEQVKVTAILPGPTLTESWEGENIDKSQFVSTDDIASIIYHATTLESNALVDEIIIRPVKGQ